MNDRMNASIVRCIVFLGMWIGGCGSADAQKTAYVKLAGDTYTIDMIEGWYKCTGEILAKGPARRKIGKYEITWTTRICPDNDGSSIAVTEFKGCKDCREIQRGDSLGYANDKGIRKVCWAASNVKNVEYSVDVLCEPTTHPETGKKEELRIRNWYVCGKNNTYLVSYAATTASAWKKWLSEMEKLVVSLREK